jgi:hypothetical protein
MLHRKRTRTQQQKMEFSVQIVSSSSWASSSASVTYRLWKTPLENDSYFRNIIRNAIIGKFSSDST